MTGLTWGTRETWRWGYTRTFLLMVSRTKEQTPKCCAKRIWIKSLVNTRLCGNAGGVWDGLWWGRTLGELLKQVSSQPRDALRPRGCSSFWRFPTPGNVDVLSACKGAESWPWPWARGLSFLFFLFCSFSFSNLQLKLPAVVWIPVDGRLLHIMTTTITVIMPSTNWLWIGDERKRNFLGLGVK